ncbi:hypothetical protein P70_0098 [Listeria phage P70]|uniref:Uncharacterized protein n=1 Tax=Listeria phage P70 TaxID=1225800 RepID=J9QPD1_9CAUD|nr:hypothetical protein P70_0098 [Listeria phage P70]AFQ96287.1 hypothetical protein P70_0098 [Listeria phage P70]
MAYKKEKDTIVRENYVPKPVPRNKIKEVDIKWNHQI